MMIEAGAFLSNFIAIANKSSLIAQIIRKETSLFDLLVENKNTNEYQKVDFKTFADVLIQEIAKYDLNNIHDDLGEKLLGEENNRFTNKLKVSIEVRVGDCAESTKNMILMVVDNHEGLANQLARIIHTDISNFHDENFDNKMNLLVDKYLSLDDIEMWIDPIDSTKEYIKGVGLDGQEVLDDVDCIKNATVLIGAYNKQTGIPFAGVICQPFNCLNADGLWTHECFWGVRIDSVAMSSDNIHTRQFSLPGYVTTAYREVQSLSHCLNRPEESARWNVRGRCGAGFKLLSLLTSENDVCILTKNSTYKWDTCGPHGILLSVGGGLVDYQKIMCAVAAQINNLSSSENINDFIRELLNTYQMQYLTQQSDSCNSGGFIAYTSTDIAISVIKSLVQQ